MSQLKISLSCYLMEKKLGNCFREAQIHPQFSSILNNNDRSRTLAYFFPPRLGEEQVARID